MTHQTIEGRPISYYLRAMEVFIFAKTGKRVTINEPNTPKRIGLFEKMINGTI